VTRYDLVTEGTIDEAICDSLAKKTEISVELLRSWVHEENLA
jgi:hypothetical protein